jgi:hypothetical protein
VGVSGVERSRVGVGVLARVEVAVGGGTVAVAVAVPVGVGSKGCCVGVAVGTEPGRPAPSQAEVSSWEASTLPNPLSRTSPRMPARMSAVPRL